jgi:hypothetical protein
MSTGLSPRQMFLLDSACQPLRHDFPGFGPYLVGSAMTGEKSAGTRDVDVRHMMRDKDYARLVKAIGVEGIRFLGIAVGQYLASLTGLPIDFQFQQQTAANEAHAGLRRNPLGVRSMGNFVGDGEPVPEKTPSTPQEGHQ